MSSLQRTRSLRKPTTSTPLDPPTRDTNPDPRNASPSRLPVKPPSRNGAASTAKPTARATTGIARTPSTRQTATTQPATRREPGRYYPPSATSTRQQPASSITRPTSSSGQPAQQPRRAPTHTRAKSTTTASAAPSLHPPSLDQQTSTRSPHTRNPSVEKTAALSQPTNPTTTKLAAHPRLRPAFNILQQHYSPAKSSAPKPLTSAILAPPSPSKLPANVAASVETNRLQTELLQLHLLHCGAAETNAAWQASAKEKLRQRYENLAREGKVLDAEERGREEAHNALALRAWAAGGGLDEKTQALDAVMNGVWALSEPGGRYARVVRRFERWFDGVVELEETRQSRADGGGRLGEPGTLFVGELNADWKDECPGLVRKLDSWRKQLKEMGNAPGGGDGARPSSLERMLGGAFSLVNNMLEEIRTMGEMEAEAVDREDVWIERMNRDGDEVGGQRAGAIWRVL